MKPRMGVRRKRLFARQKGRCHYCRRKMVLKTGLYNTCTVDHRKPRSKGGYLAGRNIVGACYRCNQAKGTMSYTEFKSMNEETRPSEE